MITRCCYRCKQEKPATLEHFYGDRSRPHGLSYECRECLSIRKRGRDRRKERWSNLTDEQKQKVKIRQTKYAKTNKGRAAFLRAAYGRIDSCDLTTEEIAELISQPCVHCGTTDINRGLDRIDNNLPHIKGNVAPSCAPCNFARGDRFTFEEMKRIGALIRQIFKDRKTKEVENEDRPSDSPSPPPIL